MAEPRHIESWPDVWRLTGAWNHDRPVDGYMIERWLRGLRPQNGATKRADGPGARAPPGTRHSPDGAGSGGHRVGDAPHGVPRCDPVPGP